MPPSDTQPLTFQRLPVGGHIDPVESLANATADEMREILEVLHDGDADAERRAAAAHEAAEKRRKHREAMVLFRLRKKTTFGDMRKQEQSLQEVLQHKLIEYRQLRERRSAMGSNQQDEAMMLKLQDEFADILTVKEALLRENRAMEGVINELAKFQKLVMDEVERQAVDDENNAASAENASPNVAREQKHPSASGGYWVKLLDNEPSVFFVPEPEENHEQLARTSFQRAMQLHSGFVHKRFDYTETFCLGWRAQHSLIGTPGSKRMLRFRFTRQVPRWFMSIDDYQRLAWPVVNTPELNARLYSTPVLMKVVQWVNDHTFVTFRNSPHRDRKMNYRYFASNSQIEFRDDQNRRAYMIHHTILDREPPLVETPAKQPIVWIKEGSQCMKFTEIDENDAIEIDHYGYMNCVSEEQARYLMIETCSILMRWEQMVVPPRLLTPE